MASAEVSTCAAAEHRTKSVLTDWIVTMMRGRAIAVKISECEKTVVDNLLVRLNRAGFQATISTQSHRQLLQGLLLYSVSAPSRTCHCFPSGSRFYQDIL